MAPRTHRTIDDVGAFRALAHPVRQQLIEDVLSVEKPLTATEAAGKCGTTPSAMSYHLRALQKYGMVERVESPDGRERPWRKTADGFDISGAGGSLPAAEARTLVHRFVESATRNVSDDDDSLTMFRSNLSLTESQSAELNAAVSRLLQDFHEKYAPDVLSSSDAGSERRRVIWINAPSESQPDST
ncbi:MAG: helix-turn-helix domain-containing protein [Allobranchiibius sp.]